MGLFNNHYNRPGPGVPKNAPKKKPFPLFFELLFRKFFALIRLNLLFFIPVVVVLICIFFMSAFNNLFIALLPVVLLSPFVAGLTYVTRNYAREEHAFIFSDFVEATKKNWKAFTINGVLCYLLFVLLYFSITYYFGMTSTNNLFFIPFGICVCLAFIALCAQYYVPVMLITFDLKYIQVIKNGLIFSIVGLWRNLMLTVIVAVFAFVTDVSLKLAAYTPIPLMVVFLLAAFCLFSFGSFLINFAVYPLIDKLMIKPYKEKEAGEAKEDGDALPAETTKGSDFND